MAREDPLNDLDDPRMGIETTRSEPFQWRLVATIVAIFVFIMATFMSIPISENIANDNVTKEVKDRYHLNVVDVTDNGHYLQWVTTDNKECTGYYNDQILKVKHCEDIVVPR